MGKNEELELAYKFVQLTNRNIFLTGKAGTGKTTFLKSLKDKIHKRMVIVAPTGVAAINAGGITIHSFFQLPFGPILTKKVAGSKNQTSESKMRFQKKKINIIKSLDLLVIDEISMVRADMLDAIDEVLRKYKNRFLPFGGVQVLMIGDMQQLAPVVKHQEWELLKSYYKSMYFFNSKVIEESNLLSIELKKVYRQSDEKFIEVLNEIRTNAITKENFDLLHTRFIPNFNAEDTDSYVTLCTHNHSANLINSRELKKLQSTSQNFTADIDGDFPENSYPTDYELELKIGAQVMFIKNDSNPEKRYYNGKIGEIIGFEDEHIIIYCHDDKSTIESNHEEWKNIKYDIDNKTKEIKEKVVGTFRQYPLRLAWAITIHKSQGLTFEKAIIDAEAAFAHGQTYVALSRCKSLEGLVLSSRISKSTIISDNEIDTFSKESENIKADKAELDKSKFQYQIDLLTELFTYKNIFYLTDQLYRHLEKNKRIIKGNLLENIKEIQQKPIKELGSISSSFINQLKKSLIENPDAEKNDFVQKRIKKASEFLHTYHQLHLIDKLNNSSFECDNTEVKKRTNSILEDILEKLKIKQESLEFCKKGFKIQDYLEVKAKSAVDVVKVKSAKKQTYTKGLETKHPELYSLLKFWRREESESMDLPAYRVASTKMLEGIANTLPTSKKQMLTIHGMGKKTFNKYGEELLDMVLEYMAEKGIDESEFDNNPELIAKVEFENEKKAKKQKKSKSSAEQSFELYKMGKSIDEIATERGFVNSTIAGHLAKFISSGELNITDFLKEEDVKVIEEAFQKAESDNLSEIIQELNNKYSYQDLRYVKNHMIYKQKLNS